MPIIFIRYVLPIVIILWLQGYLSFNDNRFLGLILPVLSVLFTLILILNSMNSIGILVSICIMFIPNILLFAMYIYIRKFRKKRDDQIIKLKFKDYKKK